MSSSSQKSCNLYPSLKVRNHFLHPQVKLVKLFCVYFNPFVQKTYDTSCVLRWVDVLWNGAHNMFDLLGLVHVWFMEVSCSITGCIDTCGWVRGFLKKEGRKEGRKEGV